MRVSKQVTELAGLLATTDKAKREASYYAVSEVIIDYILTTKSHVIGSGDFLVKLSDIVNEVNEITIIDSPLLKSIMTATVNYKVKPYPVGREVPPIYSVGSFEDLLGFNKYYSKATIENINKELTYFKEVYTATKLALPYFSQLS